MESYNNIPKMYQFLVGIKIVEFPKKVIITRSCKSRALSGTSRFFMHINDFQNRKKRTLYFKCFKKD